MEKDLSTHVLSFLKSKKALFFVPVILLLHIYSQLCLIRPQHVWQITDSYILSHYFLDYSQGFIPRGLAGTVYMFLSKYISGNIFFIILFFLSLLFFVYCIFTMLKTIRNMQDEITASCLAFAAIILFAVPPSRIYLLYHFARLDVFLFGITLFSVLTIFKDSCWKYLALFLVPAGVMIHEIFLILFLPFICATAFYKTRWKDKESCLYLALLFLSCMLSIYLLYLMRKNMPSAEVLDALCIKNNNMGKMENPGIAIYADKTYLQHFVYAFKSTMLTDYALGYIVSFFVFLAAGFYPFTLWKKAFQSLPEKEKLLRWKFLFLLAGALIPNLACLIATDHSRWQTAFLLNINLLVFLLLSDKELALKLPGPSRKTAQWILYFSILAMVSGMTTECHFSNILTGICLKAARVFKYFCFLLFS